VLQAFVGLSVTEVVASSITVVAGNTAACQEQQAAWHELLLRALFDVISVDLVLSRSSQDRVYVQEPQ